MNYTEIIKGLERLIKIPEYHVLGKLRDNLVFFSTAQGVTNISALVGTRVVRLTKEPISSTSTPKSHLDFLVFARDIEKGKEKHAVYACNLKGEEYEIASPRVRIMSLAYDDKNVAFVGSSEDGTYLYVIEEGKLKKLNNVPPFSFVIDIEANHITGVSVVNPRSQDFFIADLSGELKILTPKQGSVNQPYRIKGNKVYLASDYENIGESYWIYTYDLTSSTYERVDFPERDIYQYKPVEIFYDPEDKLIISKRDGRENLFLNGKMINTIPGTLTGATVIDNYIYFSHSSLVSPHKIYRVDKEDGKEDVVVDNEEHIDLGQVEYVKIQSYDKVEVPTYIIKSKVGKVPSTAVVYVHGGPWGEIDDRWNSIISSLLLFGYHVVAPNFRGSTGYGSKFYLMDIGDPGGGDLMDLVKVRDYTVEKKIAEKVGIMGYSYGGYMTLLALGREPDKWDFGVAGASVADWSEMYELSDSTFKGFIELLFNGKNLDLMKERSPITYVNNVKAPVCIIHSQNDSRTFLSPVIRYVQELHKAGKSFEFHVVPDAGHADYTVDGLINFTLPAIMFLEKLGKKWEKN
ncbi:acylaminoacyl-peptidase [Sulfolobus acidocaldarius SUSAZ]|nr:acylaminoacyl-peptidase [Sulfolobus acidocaldarius SUSAZ]